MFLTKDIIAYSFGFNILITHLELNAGTYFRIAIKQKYVANLGHVDDF